MRRALVIGWLVGLPALAGATTPAELVAALATKDSAPAALDQLVAMRQDAVPALGAVAADGHDVTQRGWAIVGLKRIGGPAADGVLARIVSGSTQPNLVRTWAAAARIDLAENLHALFELAPLVQSYPALRRPFTIRLSALGNAPGGIDVNGLLAVSSQDVQLQQAVAPMIVGLAPSALVQPMLHAPTPEVRMQAAGYVAAKAQDAAGVQAVATAVVQALAFQPGASQPPWNGGPLYIPSIAWPKGPATQLVGELLRWRVWSDLRGRAEVGQQIDQNLNSVGLAGIVGYNPTWGGPNSDSWLREWARIAGGREAVSKLLAEQGMASDPRYQALLSSLR